MQGIIDEVKKLWPQCKLVHGRPRHSQSQGGIERVNRTVQEKLQTWMHDNKTNQWIVGRMLVRWQINTQETRATGQMPYETAFGQKPKMGISQLPLSPALIDSLSTEAQLVEFLGRADPGGTSMTQLPPPRPCSY